MGHAMHTCIFFSARGSKQMLGSSRTFAHEGPRIPCRMGPRRSAKLSQFIGKRSERCTPALRDGSAKKDVAPITRIKNASTEGGDGERRARGQTIPDSLTRSTFPAEMPSAT